MRPALQIVTSPVRRAPRASSIMIQRAPIWISAARIASADDAEQFIESSVVEKHKRVLIPDFASLGLMNSRLLFEQFRPHLRAYKMGLIVASSNNPEGIDYDQFGRLVEEGTSEGLQGVLVVKGSGRHALIDSESVRQQYLDTIRTVRRAGGRLMLPLRIDLEENAVLQDIDRRLSLGAEGFMTQPIFNASAVSPAVKKKLRTIVKEHPGFSVRIGALWLDEEMFVRLESKDSQLVTAKGLDQYPMRPKPADGDWEGWNRENALKIREILADIAPRQELADSTYSRIGLGHAEDRVAKIASVIEETSEELALHDFH